MRLVADSNILYTYFWESSALRQILQEKPYIIYSSEKALEEIKRYKAAIMQKSKLKSSDFKSTLDEMKKRIVFVAPIQYQTSMQYMQKEIADFPDKEREELLDDLDFLALAFELNCSLWSNDKLLKKQDIVPILTTQEVIFL